MALQFLSRNTKYLNIAKAKTFSTVDLKEVETFKKHGTDWWSMSSDLKLLKSMNQIRVPFIRDGLINANQTNNELIGTDQPLKGLKILDVGCGGGYLTEPLARLGAETVGIDSTAELISAANQHKQLDEQIDKRLTYEHAAIEDFAPNHINAFDAVVSSEVIEHVTNKEEFVRHCAACLKPSGSIFLTTVNKTFLAGVVMICLGENVARIIPKGTHELEKFISPHELRRLLEDNNCITRRIHGLTYNPLTKEWSWVSWTDINYAIHAVKAP